MEKPITNPELQLPEVFKWRVPINWDPVPWWFFERANLPKEALSQLALIQLENQRAIHAAEHESDRAVYGNGQKVRRQIADVQDPHWKGVDAIPGLTPLLFGGSRCVQERGSTRHDRA